LDIKLVIKGFMAGSGETGPAPGAVGANGRAGEVETFRVDGAPDAAESGPAGVETFRVDGDMAAGEDGRGAGSGAEETFRVTGDMAVGEDGLEVELAETVRVAGDMVAGEDGLVRAWDVDEAGRADGVPEDAAPG